MIGKITKVDPLKQSLHSGDAYIRVYFDVKQEDGTKKWAKTDIVTKFRNYKKWKNLLVVDNIISGLVMKDSVTVSADSCPVLIGKFVGQKPVEKVEEKVEQLSLI
jgi:hypothetical protein